MTFEEAEFISIGSNCIGMTCLGMKTRKIKGPLDNVLIIDNEPVKCLFNNTLLKMISGNYKTYKKRNPDITDKNFKYKHLQIRHNDPTTGKFKEEFIRRINIFNDFYNHKNDENKFFIFSLNQYYLTNDKKLKASLFSELIDLLKHFGVLDKTIFIGTYTTKDLFFNFYALDIDIYIKRYNLKYVEILDSDTANPDKAKEQFIEYFNNIETNPVKILNKK